MPVRVLVDPQGDTHTKQRTWYHNLHMQTTALASPTFMSILLETQLVYNIILTSFYYFCLIIIHVIIM